LPCTFLVPKLYVSTLLPPGNFIEIAQLWLYSFFIF
jgi:hypothetical protein